MPSGTDRRYRSPEGCRGSRASTSATARRAFSRSPPRPRLGTRSRGDRPRSRGGLVDRFRCPGRKDASILGQGCKAGRGPWAGRHVVRLDHRKPPSRGDPEDVPVRCLPSRASRIARADTLRPAPKAGRDGREAIPLRDLPSGPSGLPPSRRVRSGGQAISHRRKLDAPASRRTASCWAVGRRTVRDPARRAENGRQSRSRATGR